MAIEIERRFLVQKDEWKSFAKEAQELQQGYLSTNFNEWVVRVRILNKNKSQITLKALAEGITNLEFEYPIPLNDAQSIWRRLSKKLYKTRYVLNFRAEKWFIDCFQRENFPLVIAEVELTSHQHQIVKPTWCDEEITRNKTFSNAALAKTPISLWSIESRLKQERK